MASQLNRRNKDCRPGDLLPETCYRRNRRRWERQVDCVEPIDPCTINTEGTIPPRSNRPAPPAPPVGIVVGNEVQTLSCPSPYVGESERAEYDPEPYEVVVPEATFNRFVENGDDEAAVAATQEFVNRLALGYAYSQLRCYAPNEEVTELCPEHEGSDADSLLNPANTTNTQESGTHWERMSGFSSLPDSAERFLLTAEEAPAGTIIYEAATQSFFEVTDSDELDSEAGYTLRDDYDLEDIFDDLFGPDQDEATASASLAALALLTCEYLSPETTLECPTDPDEALASEELGQRAVTLEEGRFRHLLDVVGGDGIEEVPDLASQAVTAALAALNCVYTNEEQTATCPAAEGPDGPVPAFGRNTATALAGTVRHSFQPQAPLPIVYPGDFPTVAAMNATALLEAWGTLNCLYPNLSKESACPLDTESILCAQETREVNIHRRRALVVDDGYSDDPSDLYDPYYDDAIRMLARLACSGEGIEAIDELVEVRQITELGFESTAILSECNPDEFREDLETACGEYNKVYPPYPLDAWEVDPRVSVEGAVEGGLFLEGAVPDDGVVSQEAANAAFAVAEEAALSYAESLTVCLFCNEEVEPLTCEPFLSGEIERKYEVNNSSRKVCECEFTSPLSKADAQRAAWAAAVASRECVPGQYGNREIVLSCGVSVDPTENYLPLPEDGTRPSVGRTASKTEICTEAPCINPTIDEPGYVEADTFFGDTEFEADQVALVYACSISRCGWGNQEITASRGDCNIDAGNPPIPLLEVSDGKVPANTYIDYGDPEEAKKRANLSAELLAMATRVCLAQTVITDISGFGGETDVASRCALQVVKTPNPNYSGTTEGKFFVSWGVVNNILPSHIDEPFTLPASGTLQVWLTISLSDSSPYAVSAASIGTGVSLPSSAAFGSNGTWPATAIFKIGQISKSGDDYLIMNTGCGSLQVSIFTQSWALSSSGPQVRMSIAFNRT